MDSRLTNASTPIERQVEAIAIAITEAQQATDQPLTLSRLISLLGQDAHPIVILILSILSMVWGPPGYAVILGLSAIFVATLMTLQRPLRLGGWIGARQLPPAMLQGMLDRLAMIARVLARFSRPRLEGLAGDSMRVPTGLLIMLISLPTAVPIPFINAVPNVGIVIICISRINRDGLGILIGAVVGLVGVGIAIAVSLGAVSLVQGLMAAQG